MSAGLGRFQRRILDILGAFSLWFPDSDTDFVEGRSGGLLAYPEGYDFTRPAMPMVTLGRLLYGPQFVLWGNACNLRRALASLERRGMVRVFWVTGGSPLVRFGTGGRLRRRERNVRRLRVVQIAEDTFDRAEKSAQPPARARSAEFQTMAAPDASNRPAIPIHIITLPCGIL